MTFDPADIVRIRKRLQMSRGQFAKLLGVDNRTIARYESGKSAPTGPPEAVLNGIRQTLVTNPKMITKALKALGAVTAVGGLGLLVVKAIEALAKERRDDDDD